MKELTAAKQVLCQTVVQEAAAIAAVAASVAALVTTSATHLVAASAAADAVANAQGAFHCAKQAVTEAEEAIDAAKKDLQEKRNVAAEKRQLATKAAEKMQLATKVAEAVLFENPASAAASAATFATAAATEIASVIARVAMLVAKEDKRMEKASHAFHGVAQAAARASFDRAAAKSSHGSLSQIKAKVACPSATSIDQSSIATAAGTELSFTFEKPGSFGMRFGLDGCVTDVTGQALAIGLKVGDQIVAVGGVRVDKKSLVPKLKVLPRPGIFGSIALWTVLTVCCACRGYYGTSHSEC
jgi:hypothetical protein